MISNRLRTCLAATLLAASLSSQAADIEVHHAYLNAPPPVANVAAGYFILHNNTARTIILERLSSPVAEKVELHKSTHENGQVKMRKVASLPVDSRSTVELSPGGLHLMFKRLNSSISPGDSVPITLHFKDGTNTTVDASVRDIRDAPKEMGHHNNHHSGHHSMR